MQGDAERTRKAIRIEADYLMHIAAMYDANDISGSQLASMVRDVSAMLLELAGEDKYMRRVMTAALLEREACSV